MKDITDIFGKLDWWLPADTQAAGRREARAIADITPFIQPLTPGHHKNIWDNCALIIAERCDEELRPHLTELLEWLQDMNWPGAFCILARLIRYANPSELTNALSICLAQAEARGDEAWTDNLKALQKGDYILYQEDGSPVYGAVPPACREYLADGK